MADYQFSHEATGADGSRMVAEGGNLAESLKPEDDKGMLCRAPPSVYDDLAKMRDGH